MQDFDLFTEAYPHAARHAAKLFGVTQLAGMLGEASSAADAHMSAGGGATKGAAQRGPGERETPQQRVKRSKDSARLQRKLSINS